MHIIKNLLTEDEVKDILENLTGWQEGFTNSTKEHKDNFELNYDRGAQLIAQRIQKHPHALTKLFMKRMTLPRFNKYEESQKYARHMDACRQHGVQTDWSYTLMLQPPKEGGELEIITEGRKTKVELEAGDIVIYPSGKIHQVLPVIEGTRIAAIGWIESLITSEEKRLIITNIVESLQVLEQEGADKDLILKLNYSYHNLMRLWSK